MLVILCPHEYHQVSAYESVDICHFTTTLMCVGYAINYVSAPCVHVSCLCMPYVHMRCFPVPCVCVLDIIIQSVAPTHVVNVVCCTCM